MYGQETGMTNAERIGFLSHSLTPQYKRAITQAQNIVRRAIELHVPSFVTVSWGKDSVVNLHLIQQYISDIPVIHVGDQYEDELADFSAVRDTYMKDHPISDYRHITVQIGGKSVTRAVNETGINNQYPLRYIGMRIQEGGKRIYALKTYGAIHQYKDKTWRVCPLIDLAWNDVWAYIIVNELPYLKIYDHPAMGPKSISRTSSVYSERLFGNDPKHGAVNLGRIAQMRRYAPDFYNRVVQKFPQMGMLT